jgi:hypothetical protein
MEFVLQIIAERGGVRFAELFATAANRAEVICTFLALLELIRLKQLACLQPEPFAEIEISQAVAAAAPTETVAPTPETEVAAEVKSAPPSPESTAVETAEEEVEDEFDEDDDEDDDDDDDEEDGEEAETGNDDQTPK